MRGFNNVGTGPDFGLQTIFRTPKNGHEKPGLQGKTRWGICLFFFGGQPTGAATATIPKKGPPSPGNIIRDGNQNTGLEDP